MTPALKTAPRAKSRDALRIVLPVAILAIGFVGYRVLAAQRELPVRKELETVAPLVDVVTVELDDSGLNLRTDGLVVPHREVTLSAEIAGRVLTKTAACRAGNYVTQGTPLIQIDPRDYELEISRLKQESEQAAVFVEELDVELENNAALVDLARQQLALQAKDLARLQQLADNHVATDAQLDDARRNELTARNSMQSTQNMSQLLKTRRARLLSGMELAKTQLARAELDLTRATIVAPFDGVVVQDLVEQDSYVQKGTALVTIEDTSKVEVKCNLRVDELFWLWQQAGERTPTEILASSYELPRTPVTVTYTLAGRSYTWSGVLARYDGMGLDERTRMVPCRVVVDQPLDVHAATANTARGAGPPALVRGMYVNVEVHAQPLVQLLRVPSRAIRPGPSIWRVRDDRLEMLSDLSIARSDSEYALVDASTTDLRAGDAVIVSPLAGVTDGMAVKKR